MSPYAFLGSSVGTPEAASLCVRLTAWHDAMVAHERRLRTGRTTGACDDDCPHAEARALWTEAVATLGPRASELTFLRSRATDTAPSPHEVVTATTVGSRDRTIMPSSFPASDSPSWNPGIIRPQPADSFAPAPFGASSTQASTFASAPELANGPANPRCCGA